MTDPIPGIQRVLELAERLKFELRHSWLSSGRQESVAEHTWQMALMAVLMHRHLEKPAELGRSLEMIIVHDLVEAEAGDVPFFETGARQDAKAERERAAIDRIRNLLPPGTGDHVHALWHEFEAMETPEAKFAKALDHLEVQIQHNRADFGTWREIGLTRKVLEASPRVKVATASLTVRVRMARASPMPSAKTGIANPMPRVRAATASPMARVKTGRANPM